MIKQKAAELAAAIKDSEEFKGLQSARARVQLDPKAFDLLSKLQVLQGEIIGLQQQGQPITQAVVEQGPGKPDAAEFDLEKYGGSPAKVR